MIAEGVLGRLRATTRPAPGARAFRPPKRTRAAVATALLLAGILGGAWLWVRDSSLVAVEHVTVTGSSGPDAAQIGSALRRAARTMSTLDVRMARLRTAVAPYPVVKDLQVTTQFPHGMRIRVVEQIPVGVVVAAGHTVAAVAADGTLIRDLPVSGALPVIPVRVPPVGRRITTADARAAVAALAAAPAGLRARVSQVTTIAPHGLVAQTAGGPSIYFGDATQLTAKWLAAAAVLADPGSAGAGYIDVTDPQRPAAGAGAGASASAGSGTTTGGTPAASGGTSAAAGATSPAAGATSAAAGAASAPAGGTSSASGATATPASPASQAPQQPPPGG